MRFGELELDLSSPRVMGILNVTPDSFSDGGRYGSLQAVVDRAGAMLEAGAELLDVGGESTRPGAQAVNADEELTRTLPVIEALHRAFPRAILSIDTSKAEVARAAVAAGAHWVNDVAALRGEGMIETLARLRVPVCLMHMQGEPRTMQRDPRYTDVVSDVRTFLQERVEACVAGGIDRDRLVLDPGFGFGKTLDHNLSLMRHLQAFQALGLPLLVGVSRKSMIGQVLDRPVERRLYGSIALALLAAQQGAAILRVHDVGPTVEVLKMAQAVAQAQ